MLQVFCKRIWRRPWEILAVWAFVALLTAALCLLHASNLGEQAKFEEAYKTLPVTATVTDLTGTNRVNLDLPDWVPELFLGDAKITPDFTKYSKNVQVQVTHEIVAVDSQSVSGKLVGMTRLDAAGELLPQAGASITWLDGWDESMFQSDALACLVSVQMIPPGAEAQLAPLTMDFQYKLPKPEMEPEEYRYATLTFQVAGYYEAASENIYCPYLAAKHVYKALGEPQGASSVSMTLSDNTLLEELRNFRSFWFAEPNLQGTPTYWGQRGYENYPFALEINDQALQRAANTLRRSILINTVCAYLIFGVTIAAGFFVGFLMIRQQKREIALMQTMGMATGKIFAAYFLEYSLTALLGIGLGGCFWQWQPRWQLGVFFGLFVTGLAIALLVFLRRNLLQSLKEED